MDPFRTRGHIPWNNVDNWLRAFRSIWVSTTRPDGRPHAVPVWCTWDGRYPYFISGHQWQKSKNLARPSTPLRKEQRLPLWMATGIHAAFLMCSLIDRIFSTKKE